MIILPDLGQRVMLRLAQEDGSLRTKQQADEIETRLRRLAGPDYWVGLHSGIPVDDEAELSRRLEAIDAALPDELLVLPITRHVAPLRHDANRVRRALALPADAVVWEIEEPGPSSQEPRTVRIVVSAWMPRASLPSHVEIGGRDYALESHQHSPAYAGCIKAYVVAERSDLAKDTYILGIER